MNERNRNDKYVAIKRVHSANINADYSNNACIEIQILNDMVYEKYFPTIKEVLVDMTSSSYSIVMNYFEHQSFEEYHNKLDETQTVQYIKILLLCVDKLSEKGYVHRDIKPGNVLYNYHTNEQLLIDFGLCQSIESIKRKHDKEVSLFTKHKHKNKMASQRRHSMIPLSSFPSNSKSKHDDKSNDMETSSSSKKHRRSEFSVLYLSMIHDIGKMIYKYEQHMHI